MPKYLLSYLSCGVFTVWASIAVAGCSTDLAPQGLRSAALKDGRISAAADEASGVGSAALMKKERIVFGIGWEPVSFDPLRALDSGSYYAQTLVYEGLIKYYEMSTLSWCQGLVPSHFVFPVMEEHTLSSFVGV